MSPPPSISAPTGPQAMRWWGWGHEDRRIPLARDFEKLLGGSFGVDGAVREPVALGQIGLPAVALEARARQRLDAIVGTGWVRSDNVSRLAHSAGKSYLDLVRMRNGTPQGAVDAVVYPATHEEVLAVLGVCDAGAGRRRSVRGRDEHRRRPRPAAGRAARGHLARPRPSGGLLTVDGASLTVSVAAGTRAPVLEAQLAEHDLTLGHYPDSFEFASVGGCAATRSVGQASSGYGRIDQAIQGVRLATPRGELRRRRCRRARPGRRCVS